MYIDAGTRRFVAIIMTASKMKNAMLTVTSGLRLSEKSLSTARLVLSFDLFEYAYIFVTRM